MRQRLSILFARRYFRSRGSLSVINTISRVSTLAVAIPVAAMVILLSIFNGFTGLIESMRNEFDADILITSSQKKYFAVDSLTCLYGLTEVEAVSFVLEESVMIEYRGAQQLATMRGVDSVYLNVVPLSDLIVQGRYELNFGELDEAVVGRGLAYAMGINTAFYNTLTVYAPRRGEFSSLLPITNYNAQKCFPAGIFMLDAQTDSRYFIASLEFAQSLLSCEGRASGAMVKVSGDTGAAKKKIAKLLLDEYSVLDRDEQNPSLYRIMRYEKWAIFFITLLVLIIASCSVVGTLVMLILDKKHDITTLRTVGGDTNFIRHIFRCEGVLVSGIGIVCGVLLGAAFCFVQQQWGFIKIGAETFLVDSYPIRMRWGDILVVLTASFAVNYTIIHLTVGGMVKKQK